ncbi:hypothetical protein PsYK624_171210 [Phanerochaete sordida]|uniref:Uncharacterized protein n=1 Tax=Phanerochaete sordida TaxID=48140 RepID=A0A9P3GS47_9APHY|nr:hypothetical protein PsYK624_171210 [Phanerochaete sordida]
MRSHGTRRTYREIQGEEAQHERGRRGCREPRTLQRWHESGGDVRERVAGPRGRWLRFIGRRR